MGGEFIAVGGVGGVDRHVAVVMGDEKVPGPGLMTRVERSRGFERERAIAGNN